MWPEIRRYAPAHAGAEKTARGPVVKGLGCYSEGARKQYCFKLGNGMVSALESWKASVEMAVIFQAGDHGALEKHRRRSERHCKKRVEARAQGWRR